jgi:hydroxymethylpyrimidine/phosphomethylpyrimidine kinase
MAVPPDFISQQMEAVASDLQIAAAKTGMLGDRVTVATVAREVRKRGIGPLVVDPVMVATSGDVLLAPDAIETVRHELLPLADLITPNLPEAARLLDAETARSETEMIEQGRQLLALGPRAVLLKGGHTTSAEAVDILVTRDGHLRLGKPRIETRNTHGTGCTLAAAITARLALGARLRDAVQEAKDFLWQALDHGKALHVGHGAGPVDHLFAIRARA